MIRKAMIKIGPPLYLYLTKAEWVTPWVTGGQVPINPASAYVSDVREGTKTPDETLQRASQGVPDWVLVGGRRPPLLRVSPGASVQFVGTTIRDGLNEATVTGGAACRFEDGLILSLSTELEAATAKRLGKQACVRIIDRDRLRNSLNAQIGVECEARLVSYHDGYARNHFLKSSADAWQKEFRFLWRTEDVAARTVVLPSGIAKQVTW